MEVGWGEVGLIMMGELCFVTPYLGGHCRQDEAVCERALGVRGWVGGGDGTDYDEELFFGCTLLLVLCRQAEAVYEKDF